MINGNRLWERIHELGEIGKETDGGITRFSFTKNHRLAKNVVAKYMEEAGLEVNEDHAGNLIGTKTGSEPQAPSVLIGSHIDTVKHGGKFDGALGVLAGIEVLQTMKEKGIEPKHSIEVIAFSDEEGGRFNFGMIGSRALTGKLSQHDLERKDQDGISIFDAIKNEGLDPTKIPGLKRDKQSIKCYLELHVEQGKVLETNQLPVGIVSGIAGPLWMKWNLVGESGHAGATPMYMRKDPLQVFAKIASKVDALARSNPNTVATIGKVNVKPGGVNIIPEEIEFTLDLRDIDENARNLVEKEIISYGEEICKKHQITMRTTTLQRIDPVLCSKEIQQLIEESCREHQINTMTLPSGAGHDAMQFNDVCPIGMIFVRSKDGISHNPKEFSSKEDCEIGTNILYSVIIKLAL